MVKQRLASAVMALALMCGVGLPLVAPVATYATGGVVVDYVDAPKRVGNNSNGLLAAQVESDYSEVGSFQALLEAFDETWNEEKEPGVIDISLASDIEQTYGENDYLVVNIGWTVNLDLNGHTLLLRNDQVRGLHNYGTLNVSNGVIENGSELNESYGLIDNYGGAVNVDGVIFVDYGEGGGSSVKNRTVSFDNGKTVSQGVVNVQNSKFYAYGVVGGNANLYSDGALTVGNGVEMVNYANDQVKDGYFGCYALIVNSGTAIIGVTAGKIDDPVKITGNRGAFAINSGSVIINNGEFIGNTWYGVWITNNGDRSSVEIEYAESYGKLYGIYATVDDGKQDLSNVQIVVSGGKYSGGQKSAVALDSKNSEHSWGMELRGGEFSTLPDSSYMAEGYTAYNQNDEIYLYEVTEVAKDVHSGAIYVAKGRDYDLSDELNNAAKKYAEFDFTKLTDYATESDFIITGEFAGTGEFSYSATDAYGNVASKTSKVVVYEVTPAADDGSETEEEADTITEYVTDQIVAILDGDESAAKKVVLTEESVEIGGESHNGVELVEAVLSNGYEIETVLLSDALDADLWAEADAIDEIVEVMADDEGLAALFDGNILMYAVKDGEDPVYLGEIIELGEPVTITVTIPEEYLDVPTGYERTFKMVRGHIAADGTKTADYLDVARDGDKLTFKTDKFSTFAITYADALVNNGSADVSPVTPETGFLTTAAKIDTMETSGSKTDTSGLVFAVVIMTIATVVMEVALWKRQRSRKS